MDSKLKQEIKEMQNLGINAGKSMASLVEKATSIKHMFPPAQRAKIEKAEKDAGVMAEAMEKLKNADLDISKWG